MRMAISTGLAIVTMGGAAAEAKLVWPMPFCHPDAIAAASPAPAVKESASLKELPFDIFLWPPSAAFIVALGPNGEAEPQCMIGQSTDWQIARAAMIAVAGLKFAAPRTPNTSAPGGRYLVRVSTNLGTSWVDPPPPDPLLPDCERGWLTVWSPRWAGAAAPRPAKRVNPSYPGRALREEREGVVKVVLETYSNGSASPICLIKSEAPGWFEAEAVKAVSQWVFDPRDGIGCYVVTVRFKLE